METAESLYRETLMRHSRAPHNQRPLAGATHAATGRNPLCGDEIVIQLECRADHISSIAFTARACAVCTASASLLTLECEGTTPSEALAHSRRIHALLHGGMPEPANDSLSALAGVARHPTRIRCALLPWETLATALKSPVSPQA